jgi:hypothetical protein
MDVRMVDASQQSGSLEKLSNLITMSPGLLLEACTEEKVLYECIQEHIDIVPRSFRVKLRRTCTCVYFHHYSLVSSDGVIRIHAQLPVHDAAIINCERRKKEGVAKN